MRYVIIIMCLVFALSAAIPAKADFIIYPNGDAKFGKILNDSDESIEFQFGCEKTEENVKKILKKDLLNFGPHPYCQFPPQKEALKK